MQIFRPGFSYAHGTEPHLVLRSGTMPGTHQVARLGFDDCRRIIIAAQVTRIYRYVRPKSLRFFPLLAGSRANLWVVSFCQNYGIHLTAQ